jgi:hypothetical protein
LGKEGVCLGSGRCVTLQYTGMPVNTCCLVPATIDNRLWGRSRPVRRTSKGRLDGTWTSCRRGGLLHVPRCERWASFRLHICKNFSGFGRGRLPTRASLIVRHYMRRDIISPANVPRLPARSRHSPG